MRQFSTLLFACVATVIAGFAEAQVPKVTINGASSVDNNGVAHMKRSVPFTIQMTGTAGSPFALLLSGEALDGDPGGEQDIDTGFYLAPWQPAGAFSPIHPVFDGIGTTAIANLLGQAPSNFVPDTPSPIFKFPASGNFTLSGTGPGTAFLLNTGAGPNPIVIPLESMPPTTIALYMQIVELDVQTMNLRVGNGIKVIFDPIEFPGTIAYSEATDANLNSIVLSQRQTPSRITDSNFSDGSVSTPVAVGATEFGVNSLANLDFWLIELAGFHEFYPASHLSGVPHENTTTWNPGENPDNDASQNPLKTRAQTLRASGIEFLTGSKPALNNENPEFPHVNLPGNRALFHWRNGANPGTPSYGFGILFKDTGTFRNLTPSTLGNFTGSAVISPWCWEVGITPDGDQALVVLNATPDRLFMLDLREGAATTATEVTSATMTGNTGVIYEESLTFVLDSNNTWVGLFCAQASATASNNPPGNMFRVNMSGAQNVQRILPGNSPLNTINRVDRQPAISPDFRTVAVVAGSGSNNEQVYSLRNFTPTTQVITNITGFPNLMTMGEWNDALDGTNGRWAFSKDGSLFACPRLSGAQLIPLVLQTDGTDAGAAQDRIKSLSDGGLFDLASDFQHGRTYYLTDDNAYFMFSQGINATGVAIDRFDLFRIALSNNQPLNLTNTLNQIVPAEQKPQGPYDAYTQITFPIITFGQTRPHVEIDGTFLSPSEDYWYFLRDAHAVNTIVSNPGFFDRSNLIAVSVDPGVTGPSFELTNITGTEFPPFPGEAPPTFGAPDMVGRGSLTIDGINYDHSLRRVGGGGAFDTFYYVTGRLAGVGPTQSNIDQLALFDGNNPGPAIYVTNFATNSAPLAVATGARISNVIPSQTEPKIAYVLDRDGPGGAANDLREVIVTDLAFFGTPLRIPSAASPFTRLPVLGSLHFFPSEPEGLVFATGTLPRPAGGNIDGNTSLTTADPNNPIDATAFFYRFDTDAATPIAPAAPVGQRRGLFVWSVAD